MSLIPKGLGTQQFVKYHICVCWCIYRHGKCFIYGLDNVSSCHDITKFIIIFFKLNSLAPYMVEKMLKNNAD